METQWLSTLILKASRHGKQYPLATIMASGSCERHALSTVAGRKINALHQHSFMNEYLIKTLSINLASFHLVQSHTKSLYFKFLASNKLVRVIDLLIENSVNSQGS